MDQTIRLDAKKRESSFCEERIYPLRRGERNNVTLTVAVRRDRRPYDLAGMTAHLVWQAADGKLVGPVPMDVADQAAGAVRCTLPAACYAAVGTARAYIELRRGAELVDTTDEMLIEVLDCIDADAEQAEEYKPLIAEAREATDAAIKAATKAVSDTQAAIAEVEATEAKLYPAAENILVRSETGTVAHVEDAFAGAALREITVEGACKQDGTPSPEAPVLIEVVENPVVNVCGGNLISRDLIRGSYNTAVGNRLNTADSDASFDVTPDGDYVGGASAAWGNNLTFSSPPLAQSDYFLAFAMWSDTGYGSYSVYVVDEGYVVRKKIAIWRADASNLCTNKNKQVYASSKISVNAGERIAVCFSVNDHVGKFVVEKPRLAIAGNAAYSTPRMTVTAFTFPAEHPYLAKLPDGTADEIVVDQEGNVELVARVGVDKDVREVGDFAQGQYYSLRTSIVPFKSPYDNYDAPVMCSALPSKNTSSNNEGVYRTWTGIYVKDTSGRTKAEIQAEIDRNAPLTVAAVIPETRYPLGKIEMPKAQDSIVNAWTDAEVTPNTGIEYVRDVNIVVANIESAIASIS